MVIVPSAPLRAPQVFFYKRSQIFVADVYGAFGGRGLGTFHDIEHLTMFADYRCAATNAPGFRAV